MFLFCRKFVFFSCLSLKFYCWYVNPVSILPLIDNCLKCIMTAVVDPEICWRVRNLCSSFVVGVWNACLKLWHWHVNRVSTSTINIGLTTPGNWSFEIHTKSGGFHVKSTRNPADFMKSVRNLPDFMNVSFWVITKYRSFFRKTN